MYWTVIFVGWNDHLDGYGDITCRTVVCKCGAVYSIEEGDGVPGCRDIETVDCDFCGAELARHFGDCDGRLIDASNVDVGLKQAKCKRDASISEYISKYGYNWGTPEYMSILDTWHKEVDACLHKNKD